VSKRACFDPGLVFLLFGSSLVWGEVFAAGARAADPFDEIFADFDMEILRSVQAASWPHHRRPTSAMKPAGQDL
jgi:hypothetical protein